MRPQRVLRSWLALVAAIAAWLLAPEADAAYRFAIPKMVLTVDVRPDASAQLEYEITFENAGQPIDIVDIGMPLPEFDRSKMRAWVDGKPVTGTIANSSYIAGGVEVPLGRLAIWTGRTETFRFVAEVDDLVFSDTTDEALASLRITPTWFDAGLVTGTTDLRISIVLPPGIGPDDPVLHQGVPFSKRVREGDRTVVVWRTQWTPTEARMVGVSFPRAVMSRVVVVTRWDLFYAWWVQSPGLRVIVWALQLIVFGVFFFRFSAGTGWSLYLLGAIAFGIVCAISVLAHLVSVPVLLVLGVVLELRLRRVRGRYMPPVISVEGGGIKRGLTAPEAAALLERPLPQVLTLLVFGLLKKGLVELADAETGRVRTIEPLRTAGRDERITHAGKLGVVIHDYEHAFLDAFRGEIAPFEGELRTAIDGLLTHTAARVAGFDLEQTRDYYRQVIARAWQEAEGLGPVAQRTEHVDAKLEWLWLADGASGRFAGLDHGGVRYTPPWSRIGVPGTATPAPSGGGAPRITPSFSDVAASVVGWAEGAATGVVAELSPKGGVDFGGVDKSVAAAFESTGSSGGGGRSGGGCACACAGCACACACAGGGR